MYPLEGHSSSSIDRRRKTRTESSDLLAVLDELDTDTFADGGVGLLGLDTDLFEDDALCVRGAAEGGGLVGGTKEALLVVQVGPAAVLAGLNELAGGVETAGLASVGHF